MPDLTPDNCVVLGKEDLHVSEGSQHLRAVYARVRVCVCVCVWLSERVCLCVCMCVCVTLYAGTKCKSEWVSEWEENEPIVSNMIEWVREKWGYRIPHVSFYDTQTHWRYGKRYTNLYQVIHCFFHSKSTFTRVFPERKFRNKIITQTQSHSLYKLK